MLETLDTIQIDGNKLQSIREQKGLTQQEVAEQIGVKKATVSNYERGEGKPSADILMRLFILYGITQPTSVTKSS